MLFLAAVLVLHAGRTRARDADIDRDEAQWATISIHHTLQTFAPDSLPREGPAAVAGLEHPWRQGIHESTFGALYPGFCKLAFGLAALAGGHEAYDPAVFPRFSKGDPNGKQAARLVVRPALPAMRRVVLVTSALCAVLLFLAARGFAGWAGAIAAYVLWLASPLVRDVSTHVRADLFPILFALAALVSAMRFAPGLGGARGAARAFAAGALLGLWSGLAVSSKLNGALVAIVVAIWLPLLWLRAPRAARSSFLRGPLTALVAAGTVCAASLLILWPAVQDRPLTGIGDALRQWNEATEYQQRTLQENVRIARTPAERAELVIEGAYGRHDPLAAVLGVPGGFVLTALGFGLLLWKGLRRPRTNGVEGPGASALLAVVMIGVLTIGMTLWLPLDWDRYYLPHYAGTCLAWAAGAGMVAALLARRAPSAHDS